MLFSDATRDTHEMTPGMPLPAYLAACEAYELGVLDGARRWCDLDTLMAWDETCRDMGIAGDMPAFFRTAARKARREKRRG